MLEGFAMAVYWNLNAVLEERGITNNAKNARELGVARSTFINWRRSEKVPTIDNAHEVYEALCELAGCEIGDLISSQPYGKASEKGEVNK